MSEQHVDLSFEAFTALASFLTAPGTPLSPFADERTGQPSQEVLAELHSVGLCARDGTASEPMQPFLAVLAVPQTFMGLAMVTDGNVMIEHAVYWDSGNQCLAVSTCGDGLRLELDPDVAVLVSALANFMGEGESASLQLDLPDNEALALAALVDLQREAVALDDPVGAVVQRWAQHERYDSPDYLLSVVERSMSPGRREAAVAAGADPVRKMGGRNEITALAVAFKKIASVVRIEYGCLAAGDMSGPMPRAAAHYVVSAENAGLMVSTTSDGTVGLQGLDTKSFMSHLVKQLADASHVRRILIPETADKAQPPETTAAASASPQAAVAPSPQPSLAPPSAPVSSPKKKRRWAWFLLLLPVVLLLRLRGLVLAAIIVFLFVVVRLLIRKKREHA
jgi:hypothetical protein